MPQDEKHPPTSRPFALGVLFVHGIGSQRSGDTLVQWGDVMVKTLRHVFTTDFIVSVEGTATEPDGVDPAEMVVRLGPVKAPEQWLLSECWWADTFPAPTYRELVSWSVRATPWAVAIHIAQRYWQAAKRDSRKLSRRSRKGTDDPLGVSIAVGQLLVAPVLTLLLIVLLGLGLVVGLLPIPQVRTFILAVQSVLTATVGDSLAFVESPVRAALIRARIVNRLTRLQRRCERTIVVAHSQGAAAVLDTLGGIARMDYQRQSDAVPDTLLTFGAGTKQLASLIAQSNPPAGDLRKNPALLSTWVLAAAVGLGVWLFLDLQSLAYAGGLTLVASAVFLLATWAVARAIDRWVRPDTKGDRSQRAVARLISFFFKAIVLLPLLILVLMAAYRIAVRLEIPLISLPVLLAPLFLIGVSINTVLSTEMERLVTEQIGRPTGLVRWIDIFASADPVPNGPTKLLESKSPRHWQYESIKIWNRGSLFGDHTAYWDNADGFVLRVVKACAETAHSRWVEDLPSDQHLLELDKRSAWRVGFLRLARWSNALIWAVTAAFLSVRHPSGVARAVVGLPEWVPAGAADVGFMVALVIGCAWASYSVQKWFWLRWVRSEQKAFLRKPPQGSVFVPLLKMQAVFWLVVLVAAIVIWSDAAAVKDQLSNPRLVVAGLLEILAVATASTWLSLAFKRPPPIQT